MTESTLAAQSVYLHDPARSLTQTVAKERKAPKYKKKRQSDQDDAQNLNEEFLQRELAATKARIVHLDAKIEDKDKRIAKLRARVKSLEEKDNQANY